MIASKTTATDQSSLGKAARKVAKVRFSRGSLDYFNLGYYRHDQGSRVGQKTIMGDMVMAMIREHLDSIAYKAHGAKVTAPRSRRQKAAIKSRRSATCWLRLWSTGLIRQSRTKSR